MKAVRSLIGVNALALLALCEVVTPRRATGSAQLPVPCVGGSCGASVPGFVTSGQATAVQAGNQLTVNQASNKATLNWQSFNISADGKVQFVQPSANSVALNRIYQQSPSSIFGQLTANGQIYLVNPNGIVFGSTATVNTAGLIASSLGISDHVFSEGLLAPDLLAAGKPALSADYNASNPVQPDGQTRPGPVTVQQGATLSSSAGRILLAAPDVANAGTLSAPDGQVIMAAGQKVYLQASTDSSLRGLIVEVDSGGKAWNELSGQLSAPRGNISLVGLAVNQDGRISATTTVAANGSVRLEAADTTSVTAPATSGGSYTISATNGGTLTLGQQSDINIDIDASSTDTAAYNPNLLRSTIKLTGEKVFFEGGSITAPNGNLSVAAAANPSADPNGSGVARNDNGDAQIRIHSGTSIDLSGSTAELPVSANLLAIQLRANELADDPTQRNGALRGKTVYVDTRTGTSIVGAKALQAAEQAVPRNESYWTTQGGTATFRSEGDIVAEQGSSINVSGGKTIYDGGVMQTTQLVGANGRLYDIGSANPLLTYTGVVNPTFTQNYDKWGVQAIVTVPGLGHYESGYVDGASAGSIQFAAPAMALNGALLGQAINGARQRSGSTVAAGGTLTLGLPQGLYNPINPTPPDYLTPPVIVVANPTPVTVADGTPLGAQPLRLPAANLTTSGFTNIQIYGDTSFTLPAGVPLTLTPGASLLVDAPRIDIGSSITAASGNIQLQSVLTAITPVPNVGYPGIQIESGVTLDVRGQWINESPMLGRSQAASGPTLQNGGKITLDASEVDSQLVAGDDAQIILGDNVALRASGGGWVSSTNSLTAGAGGSISIISAAVGSALQLGSGIELDAFGVNGAAGGHFSLRAPRIEVSNGGGSGSWADAQRVDELTSPGRFLDVHPSLFADFGFSSVSLLATAGVAQDAPDRDVLRVDAGTSIFAQQQTMLLNPGYLTQATGTSLDTFSHIAMLPGYLRSPSTVSLAVVPQSLDQSFLYAGLLDIETGATISTDPGVNAKISLSGVGGIYVDGQLSAPGGTINLAVPHPPNSLDPGYVPDLGIELGPHSVVDVSGAFIQKPSALGLLLGTVLDGGSVGLLADRGMVATDPGSLINVSGTSSVLDIPTALGSPTYERQSEGSAGGVVTVHSPEAISLRGGLQAAAGSGSYGNPAGGSLEVDLTRAQSWFTVPAGDSAVNYPTLADGLVIDLVSSTKGLAISTPDSGVASLGVDQLSTSGFDSVHLVAGNTVRFSSSSPLNLTQQVILDAPTIKVDSGVQAAVAANYVQIADSQPLATDSSTLQADTGTFSAKAAQIDLLGSVAFSGTQQVTLTSLGDVQLRGVLLPDVVNPQGSVVLNGTLDINAARIYPATRTVFSIESLGTGGSVNIAQTGQSAGVPLSAGGSISVTADNIDTAGTLMAPFGTISLVANTNLTLEPTSVTSVSGAGLTIPYGYTELGGTSWVYNAVGGSADGAGQVLTGIPTRQVTLKAQNLVQAKGATIDLRGGGDLYAYEYVPGTGGTTDALGANTGLYAVLPSMRGQFAPYDPQETAVTPLQPGNSIYLSGIAGLPAGIYPLLPARYALLKGAYLVKVETGYSNIAPGQQSALADGTPVVAGYLTFGTTGQRDGGYQGVAIWPGSYGRELATYQDSLASTFFAAAAAAAGNPRPSLPVDAGRLSLSVDASLNIAGNVLTGPGSSSGLSAVVDISAPNLEVTDGQTVMSAGVVGVPASVVSSWQAGSLVLGGQPNSDGSSIAVNSTTVTVDSGAQLEAGQVILVANQQIDLKPGASVLSASAGPGGKAPAQLPAETDISLTSATGASPALLAVSDLELPVAQRATSSVGSAGITIEAGATVASRGAIAIDAPGTVSLQGTLQGDGASWSLASSSIGFGAGTGTDSLQITQPVAAAMQGAGAIRLSSTGSIDLNTAVQLGSRSSAGTASIGSLTLSAQSLTNTGTADGSVFTASRIMLQGLSDFASASPTSGTGTLTFDSDKFELESGTQAGTATLAISGFASSRINATSEFSAQQPTGTAQQPITVAQGAGAGLVTAGDLSITAPIFTVGTGAQGHISALNGALSLNGSSGTASSGATGLGGALQFDADAISLSGLIRAPSGKVTLQATHDINLGANAVIDVSGTTVTIGNQTVGAEGGNAALSAGGNLNLASGSNISVSGAGDAPAGQILLAAGGNADISGQLQGKAASGAAGGVFKLDAGSLSQSLDTLGAALQGGFGSEVNVRVHTGDLALSSGGQLTSNKVSLTADTGAVDIAGTISAPNADLSGTIGLFGGRAVTLESTGQLIADTQGGARGIGGTIELGTGANGSVTLKSGSSIAASGTTADGSLRIRAPLVAGGTDIAVTLAGSNLSHLSGVYVEPVLTEAATLTPGATGPTADDYARIQSDISSMMAGAATTISTRLNPTGALPLHVRPAVDLVQSGDLTLDVAPDLSTWQFNGQPVDLTIRATGNLTVHAGITDGFQTITTGFGNTIALLPNYASADLRLVGGADIASANPLATVTGAAADTTIAANTTVATGTGEIDLVAARDIVFGGSGAKVYTAGIPGIPGDGYQLTTGIRVFNFPTGGGNVLLDAGRNIRGALIPSKGRNAAAGPSPATWQTRQGNASTPAEWGVDLGQYAIYGWNVGSLGGGDVTVNAGGDVANLSAAAVDSYAANADGTATHFASGGLDVRALGDIGSGYFYAANGSSLLSAGGGFTSVRKGSVGAVGSLIALGDARVTVEARLGALIDGIMNPTLYIQNAATPDIATSTYFTYGPESALTVQTSAGDINLRNNLKALIGNQAGQTYLSGTVYPGSLLVRSLSEDVHLSSGYMFPSPDGQLQLLAARDLTLPGAPLSMLDAVATIVPTPDNPGGALLSNVAASLTQGDIHASDPNPAVVAAGRDITALSLSVPKEVDIIAGRDILDLNLRAQNLNATDLTLISAGRDYTDTNSSPLVTVGGPGRVVLLAGRNVDLGVSQGIVTTGNLLNANLPTATGADLTVMAGLGQAPDFTTFLQKIVAPNADNQAQLISYVENLSGRSDLSFADAESLFSAYGVDEQRDLLNRIFFQQLQLSGQEFNTVPGAGFARGYAAIDAMFPNSRAAVASGASPYSGDLSLAFSRIYTLSGGDISLLVPGGLLNVGLANPPAALIATLGNRPPSALGIVAEGTGNVDIYTKGDVNVNASRIFTLGGGNILIWSDEGNIDAGKGAKSSLSAPPPTVLVDTAGNVTLNFSGAVAGSGIRTIQVNPSVSPGDVELIAPLGTVNAGDAGIGASGNITIAAQHVLGLDNIQFGGTAIGVPAQVSNIGVSLSSASNVGSGATNTASSSAEEEARKAANTAPLAQAGISWLEVFVTGLGEENCRTDDLECLKRQTRH